LVAIRLNVWIALALLWAAAGSLYVAEVCRVKKQRNGRLTRRFIAETALLGLIWPVVLGLAVLVSIWSHR
jgi:hypothetical protein